MSEIEKYKTLFEEAPIALWEEDFSKVKLALDETILMDIPIETYLTDHPEFVKACALRVRVVDFNKQAILLHEARSKKELFENLDAILADDSLAAFYDQLIAISRRKKECESVGVVRTLKGAKRYVRVKWMVVSGHEQNYDRVFVSTQDITERHLYQKRLEESENQLRNLMDNVPGVVFRASMEEGYPILFISEGFRALFQFPSDEQSDEDIPQLFNQIHPDDQKTWLREQKRLQMKGSISREYRIISNKGQQRWVLEQSHLVEMPTKEKALFEGILTDITSRIKAQERWRQSEEKFKIVFNAISDPVFVYPIESEDQGFFVEVNSFAEEVYGYTKDEFLGMEPKQLLPQDQHFKRHLDDRRKRLHHESIIVFQNTHRKKDGTLFPVEVASSAFNLGERKAIISIVRDLSERQSIERERRQWGHVLEQATESIVITDTKGAIEFVNPAFEALTGYTRSEAFGRNPRFLKSGKQSDSFYKDLWETILSGQVWHGQVINRRKDGSLITEEGTISPIRDEFGAITHFVAVKKNVTKEVLLEKKLQQAQKMEAVGRLAGGIAHDFNNILTAILGYGEILDQTLKAKTSEKKYISHILKSANRARDLVRHILSFSRGSKDELVPINVVPILKDALKFIRSALPSSIHLEDHFQIEADTILGNPTNIHQIVMNLCTNAQQALTPKGGSIQVTLTQVQLKESRMEGINELQPGPYLVLKVKDDGPGIEELHLSKIFDPFFTTKEVGKGTGLGLSVVHGIVSSHKGDIQVESDIGKGTCFSVFLPLTDRQPKEKRKDEEPICGGTENLLLVDDEGEVGDALKIRLSQLGYHVDLCDNPLKALDMFVKNPQHYALVLSDMTMPQLSGMDLSIRILEINPKIPIILCTGYHETVTKEYALQHGIRRFFIKPVRFNKLANAVRNLLDEPHGDPID